MKIGKIGKMEDVKWKMYEVKGKMKDV